MARYEVYGSDRVVEARAIFYGAFDNPQEARYAVPRGLAGQAYSTNEAGDLVHYGYSYEETYSAGSPDARWVFCGWDRPDGAREQTYQRFESRDPMTDEWRFRVATATNFSVVEDPF